MRVLYVLAQRNFFICGPRGRVSHATGFVSGLSESDIHTTVLSGPGAREAMDEHSQVHADSVGAWGAAWWLAYCVRLSRLVARHDLIVFRWRPLWFVWGLPMVFRPGSVWVEVNTPTGLTSRFFPIRWLTRFSLFLAMKLFRVIVVSNPAREILLGITTPRQPIYVLPNGFKAGALERFRARVAPSSPPTLVYFGKKQPYYDWAMLHEALDELDQALGDSVSFHIFGYVEEPVRARTFFHDPLPLPELISALERIVNPILVLPAANSPIARGGSPMKLYEYAALGVPSIVSDALADQVTKFDSFVLYSAGDRQDLIRALRVAIDDYEGALAAASRGREVAFGQYSWKALVGQWLKESCS